MLPVSQFAELLQQQKEQVNKNRDAALIPTTAQKGFLAKTEPDPNTTRHVGGWCDHYVGTPESKISRQHKEGDEKGGVTREELAQFTEKIKHFTTLVSENMKNTTKRLQQQIASGVRPAEKQDESRPSDG